MPAVEITTEIGRAAISERLFSDHISHHQVKYILGRAGFGGGIGVDQSALGAIVGFIIPKLEEKQHLLTLDKIGVPDLIFIDIPADTDFVPFKNVFEFAFGKDFGLNLLGRHLGHDIHDRPPREGGFIESREIAEIVNLPAVGISTASFINSQQDLVGAVIGKLHVRAHGPMEGLHDKLFGSGRRGRWSLGFGLNFRGRSAGQEQEHRRCQNTADKEKSF